MVKTIRVIKEYEVNIPDENLKKHLKDFREVVDPFGSEVDLFYHVAWNVSNGSTFVEGIGRVMEDGHDFHSDVDECKATDINCENVDEFCEED